MQVSWAYDVTNRPQAETIFMSVCSRAPRMIPKVGAGQEQAAKVTAANKAQTRHP